MASTAKHFDLSLFFIYQMFLQRYRWLTICNLMILICWETIFLLCRVILTVPRRYFFCGSFMFLFWFVFVMSLFASVYMCFVVTSWERADLLALVCGVYCEFVTFPLVSWVRCGTWLYRFLIFASLLTFMSCSVNSIDFRNWWWQNCAVP